MTLVEERRQELWAVLGDLPLRSRPPLAHLIREEDRVADVRERLVHELNSSAPGPASVLLRNRPSENRRHTRGDHRSAAPVVVNNGKNDNAYALMAAII